MGAGADLRARGARGAVVAALLAAVLAVVGVGAVTAATAVAAPGGREATAPPDLLVRAGRSDVVYVVAGSCAAAPCDLTLWRTTGAGGAPREATLPRVTPVDGIGLGTLRALTFASPLDGVAVIARSTWAQASVYETLDGGATWTAFPLGAHRGVLGIGAAPHAVDLVTGRCAGGYLECHAIRFQRLALSQAMAFTSVPLANQAGLSQFGTSVAAFGSEVLLAEALRNGRPVLAVSTDGGATFALRSDAPLVAINTCGLTATSARSIWAQCPTGMLVSLWHSTDGGATWHVLRLGSLVAGTDGHAFDPVAGDLAYVHLTFHGPRLLRVTGAASQATRVGPGPYPETPLLAFVNASDGLAIGGSISGGSQHLSATTDGGVHWRTLVLP